MLSFGRDRGGGWRVEALGILKKEREKEGVLAGVFWGKEVEGRAHTRKKAL